MSNDSIDLVNRLSVLGIGAAPDFPPGEVLVRWELVVEAIRRIEAQAVEIERLRGLIVGWTKARDSVATGHASVADYKTLDLATDALYEEADRD